MNPKKRSVLWRSVAFLCNPTSSLRTRSKQKMSCYHLAPSETKISIPSYETVDGVEYYLIRVNCYHNKEWTVRQRFKSFVELHEKLQKNIAISKDLLPRKKIIKDAKFLDQRRNDLEKYLQTVTATVQQLPVLDLVQFFDFHKYDIVFLLQNMALDLSRRENDKSATFTILELHAISERLRLPCPSFQLHNSDFDFSHILGFCTDLETVKIVPTIGEYETKEEFLQELISPIGTSNILPSTLNFELKPFSSVTSLHFYGIVPQNITKCDPVRQTIVNFIVNFTRAQNVQQILLPELIHDSLKSEINQETLAEYSWAQVKVVNFGNNDIWTIDSSMRLVPNAEEVNLNENRLRTVANLSSLHHLSHLNLSGNLIESVKDWHMQLGNIEILNLSFNKIKSLKGLSRLRSLHSIDLSWNKIDDFDEIEEIAQLPVVEIVGLNGNPLMLEVDYRSKVLTRFEERCADIMLDNEKCSQMEIDKALIHAALRKTKIR